MRKDRSLQNHLQVTIFGCALVLTVLALTLIGVSAGATTQETGATTQDVRINSGVKAQEEKVRHIIESPVFSEFDAWLKQYLNRNRADGKQIRQGESLATRRRELFKELIRLSPRSALDRSVSAETLDRLPASVKANMERRVSAYGDFLVYVVMQHDQSHHSMGEMTGSRIEREVVIDGFRYKAFVYGRRETMTTKFDIPLQGIILDGWMAVDESPLRKLEPKEYESLSVDVAKLNKNSIVAEVGGELVYFSSQTDVENFIRQQVEWEEKIGPVRSKGANQSSSSWTEGLKTVLFIRIDFPDKPGEPRDYNNQPLTPARAQDLINNEISPFYVSNSYNKTSLQTTVTPVVRMPQQQSFYFNDFWALYADAETAARTAGFDPNNFNLDIFAMTYSPGFNYAGIAVVGSRGSALNGFFDLRVTAHELGHNYGLLHANLWRTTDGTVIGPGNNVEYGNPFDVMGNGFDAKAHFNAQYKRRLDWLTDANVQTISSDGIYRVFAHDSSTPGGIRALKIKKSTSKNYWIEFRQLFTNNPNAFNGAMINWDYLSVNFTETQLLDLTPSTFDAYDAPLLVGQSFNDNENRIRVTVLGKVATTPASLDVKVELNVGCTFGGLGQTTESFSASGGEGSVALNTLNGCRPPATSNDSWLTPIVGDTSPVRYVVAANTDSQPRTGTMTIAGQTFTVQQGAATTACVTRPSGLVAWWQGEGNALDQTGINNGTLINSMTFGGGKIGGGFLGNYSNNAGGVEVPDSPSLALYQSMTFEGWLKFDSYSGTVIWRRNSDFQWSYLVVMIPDGRLCFAMGPNGGSSMCVVSDPLSPGQFVHFAASLDDGTGLAKMYINGGLVRQFTTTQRPYVMSGAKTYVGAINGITDELSVYNRALTASEIQGIYDAGVAATGAAGKCPIALSPLNISNVISPAGRTSGGQQVVLTGSFAGLSTVNLGGVSASWFYTDGSSDTSRITVNTPAHSVGAVQIDLTPTSGSGYSKANAFAYLPTVFTDDTLFAAVTIARAQHIIELRQAVDAMRAVAGLSPAPWTDPTLSPFSAIIRGVHILELRTYLNDAASRLGYSTSSYTDPTLNTGFLIKRVHIEELRQRIRNIAG